jgi:hypothetical protein
VQRARKPIAGVATLGEYGKSGGRCNGYAAANDAKENVIRLATCDFCGAASAARISRQNNFSWMMTSAELLFPRELPKRERLFAGHNR